MPLEKDQELMLTTEEIIGVTRSRADPVQGPAEQRVQPGERILLDDGMLELEVLERHRHRDPDPRDL